MGGTEEILHSKLRLQSITSKRSCIFMTLHNKWVTFTEMLMSLKTRVSVQVYPPEICYLKKQVFLKD